MLPMMFANWLKTMAVNLDRHKVVMEMQTGIGRWDEFTLADVTLWTKDWASHFGVPEENVSFEICMDSHPYDSKEYAVLYAKGWRLEDDETYEARIAKEREETERARKAGKAGLLLA